MIRTDSRLARAAGLDTIVGVDLQEAILAHAALATDRPISIHPLGFAIDHQAAEKDVQSELWKLAEEKQIRLFAWNQRLIEFSDWPSKKAFFESPLDGGHKRICLPGSIAAQNSDSPTTEKSSPRHK